MPLLPVALYGLEVPAGEMLVPAIPDFPATFRITMAAIDPTEPAEIDEENPSAHPRATLKLIRQSIGPDDDDEDNDEYMRALLGAGSDSEEDSEDDEDDEEVNGGPSDPAKSKKAQKDAAVKQLIEAIKGSESDEDMEDGPTNGLSSKAKGKAKATDEDDEDDDSDDSEGLEIDEFVICTLDPERTYQQALDITIAENERVFFKVTGSHTIYLTGNYVIPDDNGHNHHHEVYDSDEESEDDEDYDLSPSEDELGAQLDEESDELDGLDDPRITELPTDEEEEAPKLVSKADKKGKNKRSADALEDVESLDDLVSKSLKSQEVKSEESPKLSKKQLKKLKNNKGDAVEVKAEDSKENIKGDKKVQFAKNLEQGPSGSTPEKDAVNGKPKTTLGVKEVNGVQIDDKKIGRGPAAKKNNRVEMRYIGKLPDGKVFDSNKKGKPFAFKIGQGDVIKGWDIGVAGMQVGGERRLTIPGHLAYASNPPPGIPKNGTLVFDVKLLSIK